MRVAAIALVCAACAGSVSQDRHNNPENPDRPEGLTTGIVTWVADGDTLDVDMGEETIEVRLIGVNTPERGECYAQEPLDYLIDQIKNKEVGLEMFDIDQFGRTLGSVWLGDELINLTLVTEGMGIGQTPDDANPYSDLLMEAEESAFQSSKGLWSPAACQSSGGVPNITIDMARSQVNPPGPDDSVLADEFVVLVNAGDEAVDMSGWTLRDESSRNRLTFRTGTTLDPGATISVASDCSTDPGWCGDQSIWNNDGDLVLLLNENGTVVARARYQ